MNSNLMKQKQPQKRKKSLETRHIRWWYAIPAVVLMIVGRLVMSAIGAAYSFTDWTGLKLTANWVGLDNYVKLFTDSSMSGAVWHTLVIAIAMVIGCNVLGMLFALMLQQKFKLRIVFRALLFLPFTLSYLATGYVWQFIFQYQGPLNQLLKAIGLESWQRVWLADVNWAMVMIIVVMVWQYSGLAMVLYLAGLESIPDEIYDSVAVDGASKWMKFWKVTLPLLAPAIIESFTMTLIWGLSAFDQITALTDGGPSGATETLATIMWKYTYKYGHYGYGTALAVVLTILIAVIIGLVNRAGRKWEERL